MKIIELRKISILDDNIKECIELEVLPEQKNFVAHNATSLGQAYAKNHYEGNGAVSYSVHNEDGNMIGFVMYEFVRKEIDDVFGEDCYYFWRLMIDKNHQRKGYAKQVVKKILDEVRTKPLGDVPHMYISYEPENTVAKKLYESFGFVETGQVISGENVAKLLL